MPQVTIICDEAHWEGTPPNAELVSESWEATENLDRVPVQGERVRHEGETYRVASVTFPLEPNNAKPEVVVMRYGVASP